MNKSNNNPLKLHVDGRMIYMSGIGRCLREIIKEIISIDKDIKFYLYGKEVDYYKYLEEYSIPDELITFTINNNPIYSFKEQFIGSWNNFNNTSDDVFYNPQYNLPYIIQKNSVFTIHDFTQFKFPEYFGKNKSKIAKLILGNAVRKAKKVIVVSKSTKKDFNEYFPDYKEKVEVIYNGISNNFRVLEDKKKNDFINRNNLNKYILFVGNNKPHKNI